MKKTFLVFSVLFLQFNFIIAQNSNFDIHIEPITISGLPGIQSYAFGQYDGKWLLVGGRLDGLHRRQPSFAFSASNNNTNIIVVDPVLMQQWIAPLTSLPSSMQEQLSSTNMEFYQQDSMLYCIGGYGYSATNLDHITYGSLTAINVPKVINAIINGNSFVTFLRQINDPQFAITGGRLEKIYENYYLVGGQKFIGRYNPMGPTHGPGFFQQYTNAIKKFTITDNGTIITINHLSDTIDSVNLHRRDFNVSPQILPNGEEGLTAFSGVFQTIANIPFLNCVNIDSTSYSVNNAFSQYYNHYHCANIPLYSAISNEMHTLFFGGIAQYFSSSGILVQDNNVPFVKTIASVIRDGNGIMSEHKFAEEMPSLLGAGSEFIAIKDLPAYGNHVLKLDSISNDTTMIGYIFGGISSTAANIFLTNTGSQSIATNQLFKVFLIKNSTVGMQQLNNQSMSSLKMQVFPNPNNGQFNIKYTLIAPSDVTISFITIDGKIIDSILLKNVKAGENSFSKEFSELTNSSVFITIQTSKEKATQKIIIEK